VFLKNKVKLYRIPLFLFILLIHACSNSVEEVSKPSEFKIYVHPLSKSAIEGESATFAVGASSPGILSYQWRKNSLEIVGASSRTYTTPPLNIGDNGSVYDVVLKSGKKQLVSKSAVLSVLAIPPSISSHPTTKNVNIGDTVTFDVSATGTAPLSYQWLKNGDNIIGAISASYTSPVINLNDDGADFSVVITNLAGSVTSNSARLNVLYKIRGNVSGLTGSELALFNNGIEQVRTKSNGEFSFTQGMLSGSDYLITIAKHPVNQRCSVSNGNGKVSGNNITDILVVCVRAYSVSGTISGLSDSVVLDNFGDKSTITNSNQQISLPFGFGIQLIEGQPYNVVVTSQPLNQYCSVTNGNGTVGISDVTNIIIVCLDPPKPHYSINGAGWNRYVKNDGTNVYSATDTACVGTEPGYKSCINGGEVWSVTMSGINSCNGVSVIDSFSYFNWVCDETTTPVKVISTGLSQNSRLSDLLDFTGVSPVWKDNNVTISIGNNIYASTPATAWLNEFNPVIEANTGLSANTALEGEVYVVTAPANAKYVLDVNSTALVVKPGVILTGPGTSTAIIQAINEPSFVWIEANIDSTGDNGVTFNTNHSVAHNLTVQNSNTIGLDINAKNGFFKNITVASNGSSIGGYGISTSVSAYNNQFVNIFSSNNADYGISSKGSNETWIGVNVSNSRSGPVFLGFNNRIIDLTSSNNFDQGISFAGNIAQPCNNILINASTTNNGREGLFFYGRNRMSIMNIAVVANTLSGPSISLANSGNITILNSAIVNNGGASFLGLGNLIFTGILKFGNNSLATCSDCTIPPSDPLVTYNVDASLSFVAKSGLNDVVNSTSQIAGGAPIVDISDWINFENVFRSWGKSHPQPFPNVLNRSYCRTGDICAIKDWSLKKGDTGDGGSSVLMNQLALPSNLPAGKKIVQHTWTAANSTDCGLITGAIWDISSCYSIYLRNAVEIVEDGIGNDNGLCESNEQCLFTPNISSYQGHGNLIDAGTFSGDGLTGINLKQYEYNGY